MSDSAPNSEIPPDAAPASPEAPQAEGVPPLNEEPSGEPDRVVASLRAELRETLEAKPKSESRLLGFFSRKRRTESEVGVETTLAPREPAFISPDFSESAPSLAPVDSPGDDEPTQPMDFEETGPGPDVSAAQPAEPFFDEERYTDSPSTAADMDAAPPELQPEEWEDPTEAVDSVASSEADSPLSVPDPDAEPAIASSAEAPAEAASQPTALQGEVLPPERFEAAERSRASEPERVITMQPGVPRSTTEDPPVSPR